ncbi:Tm-1-like ATP-binding domain-containing protein [Dorea sp. D27]|uniref:Tm-1-like ATP-binding domain-containing protein n=1 Tax=Dorea sp. D27 TaxID=658665 RepID=UPI0006739AF9|nr:Tm-1-like ATP-binding domain-containing protein [Dorea sp. D27]KMZ53544.1 transcriptional regulator [Dorea sp. D27]
MKTIAVIGAFDTKGREFSYLRDRIEEYGAHPLMIDVGVLGEPQFRPDITAVEIADLSGTGLRRLREQRNRKAANDAMIRGIKAMVEKLHREGRIQGAVSMGGGQGTHIAASAMSALPIGFPKVILSTVATVAHAQSHFEDINDTMVMNSLVDIQGLNYLLRSSIRETAAAVVGLARNAEILSLPAGAGKRIAMSMFGITTPCVSGIQEKLERNGYEALVFHTTGMGGRIMEKAIRTGLVDGVIDVTLGEITSDVFGIPGGAGGDRLCTAGKKGIPQIIVPGAVDVLNFMPPETMPPAYEGRKYLMHNTDLKVVRTNIEENKILGEDIARRLNYSTGKTVVIIPLRGVSANDCEGKEFYSPEADRELFKTMRKNLKPQIEVIELDYHINAPEFADYAARFMMEEML